MRSNTCSCLLSGTMKNEKNQDHIFSSKVTSQDSGAPTTLEVGASSIVQKKHSSSDSGLDEQTESSLSLSEYLSNSYLKRFECYIHFSRHFCSNIYDIPVFNSTTGDSSSCIVENNQKISEKSSVIPGPDSADLEPPNITRRKRLLRTSPSKLDVAEEVSKNNDSSDEESSQCSSRKKRSIENKRKVDESLALQSPAEIQILFSDLASSRKEDSHGTSRKSRISMQESKLKYRKRSTSEKNRNTRVVTTVAVRSKSLNINLKRGSTKLDEIAESSAKLLRQEDQDDV
ncbi:hypothetical protein NPIL_284631 [Nephila pilipes]|uniref:Uncharacterized protein n=1 Tax=Nephila pilipes TaxID=299642 RepID=A0A8X6T8L9_NEPPI|nr:hypothetical protein NPIL_284631 [Nephila pilipes]